MQNNKTENNYIDILKNSLEKKLYILDKIISINSAQADILKADDIDFEKFDETISQKQACIDEITLLDKGFQTVYDRVKELIEGNKDWYAQDIKTMQSRIREITEKSMDIQSQEARNKESFQSKVVFSRKEIRNAKTANKVAASYYQNMNKLNAMGSQFLDTKK